MTDPATFANSTARHAFPFLFVGQSQKEFTVNEALARIDQLISPAIFGEAGSDPAGPNAGDCYLVVAPSSGAFAGHENRLAGWDGNQWTFTDPVEGMQIFDRSDNSSLIYRSGWKRASKPANPTGGTTIDAEARDAIAALIEALRVFGVFS